MRRRASSGVEVRLPTSSGMKYDTVEKVLIERDLEARCSRGEVQADGLEGHAAKVVGVAAAYYGAAKLGLDLASSEERHGLRPHRTRPRRAGDLG